MLEPKPTKAHTKHLSKHMQHENHKAKEKIRKNSILDKNL